VSPRDTIRFLDLRRQTEALRADVDASIGHVLDTGELVLGQFVERFERAFAEYCGAPAAVGVASGTDAIALALRAVGVGPGDEVITAANTCVPTVVGIELAGATPVLVDPDPVTFTLDPDRLEDALSSRTSALVPVHLYGQCCDMDPILAFARKHGIRVVEDAAQAHGAEYRERRAGTLADAAAFSFYPTKNLGALGDAGAVVTSDGAVAERVRLLRSYGEERRYSSVLHGINSRLDALQAAVLAVKLSRLDGWNDRRRAIAAHYEAELAEDELALPTEAPDRRHVYHLFVVRPPDRAGFRSALAEHGVETLIHYPAAIHEHPAYAGLARPGRLDYSEHLAAIVVSLPLYPELTDAEVEHVASSVRRVCRRTAASASDNPRG
jgi:dTDP-4-amino-4,6-dideoxygalactose transaminase